MMNINVTAPYIHTDKSFNERPKEWAVAIIPVLGWSIFMFGARVISLAIIGALFSLAFDFLTRRFILKAEKKAQLDFMAAIYGVLSVFMMPVTVPLFLPIVSAALVVIAKNIRAIRKKRLFNPFVFSAAVMNLVFPSVMTAFTRPFAYFSAFDIVIDSELMKHYRVLTPLQYMADGSVYEDGVLAQLYGFASGNLGEIAVAAMIISLIWLVFRKEGSFAGTAAMLFTILLLGLMFPSDDAESNYYAYSVILSGAIVFISVFALNESHTVPFTFLGKIIFGVVCGIAVFALRKTQGGVEWGYLTVLVLNIASPFIEMLTKPRAVLKKKPEKASEMSSTLSQEALPQENNEE